MDIQYAASMPRFYIVQHQSDIEEWANTEPLNPANEMKIIGGVTLMRRAWDNVMHVSPHAQIDEWHLHRWDAGFVDAANANELRKKL